MIESVVNLSRLLKTRGRSMSRQKYQRPAVKLWKGKSGETFWCHPVDGDPRDLQAIPGHSRLDMTMKRYKKPIVVRQQADVEELEARLSCKAVSMPSREKAV
jgi:hypothetical protein